MPLTPKESETLRHDQVKREIGNQFTYDLALTAAGEGAAGWIIGILETVILAIIALLMLPEPAISKAIAIILSIVSGLFAIAAIAAMLAASWGLFRLDISKRDRAEDAEDSRHREALAALPE